MEAEQASTSNLQAHTRIQFAVMSPTNGHKSIELFEAQAHLYGHIYSFLTPMCLKWAVEFGIPDIIHNHGQPITLSKLVSALQVPPSKAACVHRLMRLLVHNGFFAITKSKEEEAYGLTPESELLVKGTDHCLSSMIQYILHPENVGVYHLLGKWMQAEDVTISETAFGARSFEALNNSPEHLSLFNEAMASDSQMVNLALSDCNTIFEGLDSIVDVGGGTGTTAKILGEAFPNLKFIVLDLPQVVANLPDSNNLSFVGGDMFDYIPPADAILLKWILHNWSDDDCIKILKKSKEAISAKGKGGKVIIIDIVINEKQDKAEMSETKFFFDIVMATVFNSKERSEEEWKEIFVKAGYKDYKIFPILGFRSLIELSP